MLSPSRTALTTFFSEFTRLRSDIIRSFSRSLAPATCGRTRWKYVKAGERIPCGGTFLCFREGSCDCIELNDVNVEDVPVVLREYLLSVPGIPKDDALHSDFGSIGHRPETADEAFGEEVKVLSTEIRERVERLRLCGVGELLIRELFEPKVRLSRLVVTPDRRILLPDYDNMEIRMEPLPKAVYLLFLRHGEGILFKRLADYRDELISIYMDVTKRLDIARNYYVWGEYGQPKKVALDRSLVIWEG